jgi:hypothetical protein
MVVRKSIFPLTENEFIEKYSMLRQKTGRDNLKANQYFKSIWVSWECDYEEHGSVDYNGVMYERTPTFQKK